MKRIIEATNHATKHIDMKMGKGFCWAVSMQTFTPILAGRLFTEFTKSAFTAAAYRGINGPMRTGRKYTYEQKADIFIQLFVEICKTMVDESVLHRFQEDVLYRMVDDGMFANLNFEQFIRQMRSQFVNIQGIDGEILDIYLEDSEVVRTMHRLWNQ